MSTPVSDAQKKVVVSDPDLEQKQQTARELRRQSTSTTQLDAIPENDSVRKAAMQGTPQGLLEQVAADHGLQDRVASLQKE